MNKNNKKVMSIAIEPDLHDNLKEYSKRKAMSASAYISELVKKALKINIDDEPMIIGKPVGDEILPVVLKIPSNLKGNKEGLTEWMNSQVASIVKKLAL